MQASAKALGEDLRSAGYTVDELRSLWGGVADAALHRGHQVPAVRALERLQPSRLSVLARLFVLGLECPVADVESALPTVGVSGAERLGLIVVDGGIVRPLLDIRPYAFVDDTGAGEWFIASDPGELTVGGPLPESHVLGVGGASLTLAGLQITTPVDTVLDLGTGSGIQALHASRYAGRVIATDISERALQLAQLNAELNDITLETRLGSLFDPVEGERFDRIVSNPPFVITPRLDSVPTYEYRDGGLVGDALVEAVVRGVSAALVDGGIAALLGNWEYRRGEDGLQRVRGWVEQSGLDAWVIERERQDPSLYAETWIRDGGTRPGTAEFAALHAAWLDDFESREVTSVGFGYLLLRRPTTGAAPTLHRYERVSEALGDNAGGLGTHLMACLAGHDWQVQRDDDALLESHLTVAPDVTEQRHLWPGDEHPAAIDLRQGGGFGRTVPLDTALAGFIGACDGELSVGQIVTALAELLEVEVAALRDDLLPRVRALIDDAMLIPS